jgi:hypothetical protein
MALLGWPQNENRTQENQKYGSDRGGKIGLQNMYQGWKCTREGNLLKIEVGGSKWL